MNGSRRGNITLEAILVIPILAAIAFSVIQFGILMVVQQTVTTAAIDGARAAAKEATATAAANAAEAAVDKVLALHKLQIDDGNPASDTVLIVQYGNDPAIERGDPGLDCFPPAVTPAANEVQVTICVDLTTSPLLSLPDRFGVNFTNRRFEISSMATIE